MKMKPFKVLSEKEQRERYPAMLRRSYTVSRQRILAKYEDALEEAQRVEEKAGKEILKIGDAEDKVADAADRHYGSWKWRHNQRQMDAVWKKMIAASNPHRVKNAELVARAKALRKPCLDELDELDAVQKKLMDDVLSQRPLFD